MWNNARGCVIGDYDVIKRRSDRDSHSLSSSHFEIMETCTLYSSHSPHLIRGTEIDQNFVFFSVLKMFFPKLSLEKLLSIICPPFRASLEVLERCGYLPIKRTGSGRKWKGNIRERELAVVVILTLDQVPSTVCYRTNTF